jgi:hypothetical protein
MAQEHPFALDPSPEHLADPRFEPLLRRALRRYDIPERRSGAVAGLVSGEIPYETLFCCRTGCQPCAMDFKQAAAEILKALSRPDDGGGRLRGGLRRIRRRLSR